MFELKRIKNENPLTYFRYTFIEFKFIETREIKGVNFIFFNMLIKIRFNKTR